MKTSMAWRLLILGLLPVLISACSPQEAAEPPQSKKIPVTVITVENRELPVIVEAVGRLNADREVTLAAQVGGVIQSYGADIGDPVKTDQVLVHIDPTDYRLALNESVAGLSAARAQLEATQKGYERSRALLPRRVISEDAFERAEAEYKGARASTTRARALVAINQERLNKTEIKAPFDGLLAARMVEIGQTVAPGQPVMALVDLSRMRVRIHVSERDYVDLDPRDPVTVIVEAYPDGNIPGRIDRIGIKADERTNTFTVDILVDNPDLTLKAGLTARVKLTTRIVPEALLIPQSAVLYRADVQEVFVVGPGNRADIRRVTLGRTTGSSVRVLDGLSPGDRLVTAGAQYLKKGDAVVPGYKVSPKTP